MNAAFIRFVACVGLLLLTVAGWAERGLLPGDVIRIDCPENVAYCVERTLDPTGSIQLPGLPDVLLAKQTPAEAEQALDRLLITEGQIADPHVNVRILPSRAHTVRVVGLVKRGGLYSIEDGTTLEQLLAQAELLPTADVHHVTLRTVEGEVLTVDLKERPWRLRFGDLVELSQFASAPQVFVVGGVNKPGALAFADGMTIEEAVAAAGGAAVHGSASGWRIRHTGEQGDVVAPQGLVLQVGDTVVVPLIENQSFVAVSGAVVHPGSVGIREGMRLTEVLKGAGGFASNANLERIEVRSMGERKTRRYSFSAILNGKQVDPVLKAGDTVKVFDVRVKGGA